MSELLKRTAPARARTQVVFLFDVDNTLLDYNHVAADLKRYLNREFGEACEERYWAIFEELRAELGYDDTIRILTAVKQMWGARLTTDIDSLDQWGVELGTALVQAYRRGIASEGDPAPTYDSSTNAWIRRYRQNTRPSGTTAQP